MGDGCLGDVKWVTVTVCVCLVQIYRLYVLAKLPHLHDLDMTTVTEADRTQAATYRKFNPPRTKKRKKSY